jgi:hypothetical protein
VVAEAVVARRVAQVAVVVVEPGLQVPSPVPMGRQTVVAGAVVGIRQVMVARVALVSRLSGI